VAILGGTGFFHVQPTRMASARWKLRSSLAHAIAASTSARERSVHILAGIYSARKNRAAT
jgi:hypothetical protein